MGHRTSGGGLRRGGDLVDVKSEQAVRVAPHMDVREKARRYAPEERRHYFAQLRGYQVMPDDELLHIRPVHLAVPVGDIVSRAGVRVSCAQCGEEIINGREVAVGNRLLLPVPGNTTIQPATRTSYR